MCTHIYTEGWGNCKLNSRNINSNCFRYCLDLALKKYGKMTFIKQSEKFKHCVFGNVKGKVGIILVSWLYF